MKRYHNIINQVLVVGILASLLAFAAVANAGSGVDPLVSPLPTSQEAAPRVTLAPPPMVMMPTQPAPVVPQSAGASPVAAVGIEAAEECASCMTVEVTLCDGQVITLSAQRIEVK